MTARRGWAGRGSTSRWRKVRAVVLARDGYVCQIAGPRCTGLATSVDHILSLADGGPMYDLGNLRAACETCNKGRAGGDHRTRRTVTGVEVRTVW